MIDNLSQNLCKLKKDFKKKYSGQSHIQEIIPSFESEIFPVAQKDLELLHQFTTKNPIYYNSYEESINDVTCVVYEGDINKYWLNSIQHGSSHAPFSPTWIMSAYLLSMHANELGFREIVDIGSGDGRIAFCAKILNLQSYSIEIDELLVDLQNQLSTILDFHPYCSNATAFDYSSLNLSNPAFFIGGLAQMGGTQLASGVIEKINLLPSAIKNMGWVFAGTISKKYPPDPKNNAGWGTLIEQNNLKMINTISLPTVWTFHEPDNTQYVFCSN